jgi:hypothetical protein
MVSGLVCNTGSGRAAIATLLTADAAMAPPAIPAALKNCLLEFTLDSFEYWVRNGRQCILLS